MIILTESEIQDAIEAAFKNPKEYRDAIEVIYDKILEMQLRQGRVSHSAFSGTEPKFSVEHGVIV